MKIDYIKVVHPTIKDRKITLIFIDNKLDLVSAKFLMYEARHGGSHGFIPGRESHKLRANRIGELSEKYSISEVKIYSILRKLLIDTEYYKLKNNLKNKKIKTRKK